MPRDTSPLLVALVALVAVLPGQTAAASTVTPVSGVVRAMAFSGDALIVARQPPRGGVVLERLVPGSPAETILATTLTNKSDEISLAASADALAFGLHAESGDGFAPSRVVIGQARGPLRDVATCPAGLAVSPVAVAGTRIAWREGACGHPDSAPESMSMATIVVGGADPAAPLRRVAIPGEVMPLQLVLGAGDNGLVGMVRPSFFGFDSEVRGFGPPGLGATVTSERGGIVSPVGILDDGTRVFLQSRLSDEDECGAKQLFTIAPATSTRRPVTLGDCLLAASILGPRGVTGPLATGDQITGFVGLSPARPGRPVQTIGIASARGDGSDRRLLVEGSYRQPWGIAMAGGQVAWLQPHCAGGQEIVVQSAPEPTARLASCRAAVITRRARVHDGRISVRIRCPGGCTGSIVTPGQRPRPFRFEAATRTLSLPVTLGKRRRATMRFFLTVDHGPSPVASIKVRR